MNEVATITEIREVEYSLTEQVIHRLAELDADAVELKAQAERATVDSEKTLAAAGDLHRVIRGQDKQAEEYRKGLIAPVKRWVDQVSALFKVSQTDRAEAARIIKQKADAFQRAREEEARRAAEAARKAAEEKALADAQIAEQLGDTASAEAILDTGAHIAAQIEEGAKPGLVRGDYGATVGTRRTVKGEVEDVSAFLHALADGKVGFWKDFIKFNQTSLNSLARSINNGADPVPGLKVVVENTTNFR